MRIDTLLVLALGAASLAAWPARDDAAEEGVVVQVTIKDHHFTPSEIHVPSGKPVRLEIANQDPTAEEFDSHALKVEKVIAGRRSGSVRIRPLAPGRYPFVGEYHEDAAKGVVVAD
jgi:plastocyanin